MSVGLVSDVPNDTVVGGVEDIMERHGQFHHTETRSEMPWIVGQLVDDVLAEFIADVGQRLNAQSTQVFGRIDVVEIFEIVFLFHQTVFVLAPFIMPRSMAEERRGTDKYNDKGFVSSRYCKGEISEMGADEPITYEENVTYDYTKIDEQGNWTKRTCHGATGRDPWTETRTIVYY